MSASAEPEPESSQPAAYRIRPWREGEDDLEALTVLLHRAYAGLAAAGLRYTATYQTPEVTLRRLQRGTAFMAEETASGRGQVIGTITVYGPDPQSESQVYRQPDVWCFGQFGVDPAWHGRGVGAALHRQALRCAREAGARRMALDTAAPATELIAMYQHWGYAIVETVDWPNANYPSVILCQDL